MLYDLNQEGTLEHKQNQRKNYQRVLELYGLSYLTQRVFGPPFTPLLVVIRKVMKFY